MGWKRRLNESLILHNNQLCGYDLWLLQHVQFTFMTLGITDVEENENKHAQNDDDVFVVQVCWQNI